MWASGSLQIFANPCKFACQLCKILVFFFIFLVKWLYHTLFFHFQIVDTNWPRLSILCSVHVYVICNICVNTKIFVGSERRKINVGITSATLFSSSIFSNIYFNNIFIYQIWQEISNFSLHSIPPCLTVLFMNHLGIRNK